VKFGLGLYGPILTQDNFRFARQAGATHIVAHIVGWSRQPVPDTNKFPGYRISPPDDPIWTYAGMLELKKAINSEGLELEAIENFEPAHWYDVLLDGPRKQEQIEHLKRIIRDMGKAGIPVMGYNFSYAGVWGRHDTTVSRGGAPGAGFHDPDQPPIPAGMVWNMVYDPEAFDPTGRNGFLAPISQDQLWQRFTFFLQELLPVAEEAGVKLALHPDDPPVPLLRGTPRLVYQPYIYDRVLDTRPSPMNTLEFCLGTLSEMTEGDIYDVVDKYTRANKVAYIHFRNVRGKVPHYDEVFLDEGDTDMIRVIRILHRNRYNGVLIPDHTPAMSCAAPWHAGMAYALGYMRAAARIIEAE